MKKSLVIIVLISFTFGKAQTNVVKVNPVGIAFGIANAGYEITIADKQSVTISGTYFKESGDKSIEDVIGYGAVIDYNFYFSSEKNAPIGFHVGPGAGVFFLSDDIDNVSVFYLNGTAGHQWVLWEHFAVDLFAQFSYFTQTNLSAINSINYGIGLSIGYAW